MDLRAMADLVTPMAIRVAATLGIADQISSGVSTTPGLAAAVKVNPDALERVLRHLTAKGMLSREESGRYSLTELGEGLRDENIRAMLDIEGGVGRGDLAFAQLLHTVRTGEPGFPVQFGQSFWDDLATDSGRTARYAAEMGSDVTADAPAIVAGYDWESLGRVVDVGGGNGALLTALLNRYPSLHGGVFDLPEAAELARKSLAAAGFADRSDVVAGSFFEPLPAGAGGYLLSAIIHDWDDDAARAILRRCAEAAGPEGRVFIVEKIGADGETVRTGMDLRMLVYFGGKERGVAELTALAADSDLRVVAVHPAEHTSILELRVAD